MTVENVAANAQPKTSGQSGDKSAAGNGQGGNNAENFAKALAQAKSSSDSGKNAQKATASGQNAANGKDSDVKAEKPGTRASENSGAAETTVNSETGAKNGESVTSAAKQGEAANSKSENADASSVDSVTDAAKPSQASVETRSSDRGSSQQDGRADGKKTEKAVSQHNGSPSDGDANQGTSASKSVESRSVDKTNSGSTGVESKSAEATNKRQQPSTESTSSRKEAASDDARGGSSSAKLRGGEASDKSGSLQSRDHVNAASEFRSNQTGWTASAETGLKTSVTQTQTSSRESTSDAKSAATDAGKRVALNGSRSLSREQAAVLDARLRVSNASASGARSEDEGVQTGKASGRGGNVIRGLGDIGLSDTGRDGPQNLLQNRTPSRGLRSFAGLSAAKTDGDGSAASSANASTQGSAGDAGRTAAQPGRASANPSFKTANPVHQQVSAKIVQGAKAGHGRVTVNLHPPQMGRVEVRMNMAGNNVRVRLGAETQEAMEQLQRNARSLEKALADAGFDTGGGLEFDFGQGRGSSERRPTNPYARRLAETGEGGRTFTVDAPAGLENAKAHRPERSIDVKI